MLGRICRWCAVCRRHRYYPIHRKVAPLGDPALLFPAHGAGAACAGNETKRHDRHRARCPSEQIQDLSPRIIAA